MLRPPVEATVPVIVTEIPRPTGVYEALAAPAPEVLTIGHPPRVLGTEALVLFAVAVGNGPTHVGPLEFPESTG